MNIPYNYTPRKYQEPFYNSISNGYRRGVAVCHRRWGKDKTAWNLSIKESFKRVGSYFYFLPTLRQGRKIIWEGMDKDGFRFIDHIPKEIIDTEPNNTEMKIKLINKSLIQVVGTDNPDAIRGTNPLGCVFSEFSYHNPIVWEIVEPILIENGGYALFLFTPFGKNHAYRLAMNADKDKDWLYIHSTVDDTNVILIDEINKSNMSDDMKQQEYWCSYEASVPGAYYSKEITSARNGDRICGVPVETNLEVDTFWDLGIDDSTTIWFRQRLGREIHLVNCYSNSGEAISHYVNYVKEWRAKHNVIFGTHYLPHDSKNRSLQTGKSILSIVRESGLDCSVVNRPNIKSRGIEAVRLLFPRCWFDKINCERGIEALAQYRSVYDDVNDVNSIRPVHDWTSHYADAFQTMGLYEQRNNYNSNAIKINDFIASKQFYMDKYMSSNTDNLGWMGN